MERVIWSLYGVASLGNISLERSLEIFSLLLSYNSSSSLGQSEVYTKLICFDCDVQISGKLHYMPSYNSSYQHIPERVERAIEFLSKVFLPGVCHSAPSL